MLIKITGDPTTDVGETNAVGSFRTKPSNCFYSPLPHVNSNDACLDAHVVNFGHEVNSIFIMQTERGVAQVCPSSLIAVLGQDPQHLRSDNMFLSSRTSETSITPSRRQEEASSSAS